MQREFSPVYGNVAFQSARGRDSTSTPRSSTSAPTTSPTTSGQPLPSTWITSVARHRLGRRVVPVAGARLSADAIVGSGLRADETLADGSSIPNGAHLPTYTQVNLAASHKFQLGSAGDVTLRMDVVNAFDRVYEIRNGTGVGVGAPQFGPRRGVFFGISKSL